MMLLLTILLSLTPFFWHSSELQHQFFGYGDYLSPINAVQEISNRLFMFYPKVGTGGNIAFLTPHIFPFLSWHALLSFFRISPLITSLAFLSLILFCAQISMEAWMNYILRFKCRIHEKSIWFFSFIAGKLYGFAPLVIWLIASSHIYQLIAYALFPWMLLLIDKLLMNSLPKKVIFRRLFFLFLCSASAFANIGILYVLFVVFFLYIGSYLVTKQVSLPHAFVVLISVIGCAVAANIWWLLPYLYTINETININLKSNIINANISGTVSAAYVLNIFLGHPELLLYLSPKYKIYLSLFFEIGTLILIGSSFLFLRYWKKYRYYIVCFIMLISAIYIIKGDQPPLPSLFVWLYAHFPGFQIFRRPVSKYYFVYWFFLLTFSISYFSLLYQRLKNNNRILSLSVIFFLSIFIVGIVFAFVLTKEGNSFSIPQYYYEASSYLQTNNATRVLLLPDLNGLTPSFNNKWIRYGGIDFFPIISKTEFIIPDETSYTADSLSKRLANKMVLQIRNEQSLCETAAQLGISHIVLRLDLYSEHKNEDIAELFQQKLLKSGDIEVVKFFNPGVSTPGLGIFAIRPDCRRSLIQTSSGTVISQTIYPGLVTVHVKDAGSGLLVKYLYHYSDQWSAYKDTGSPRLPTYLRAAGYVLRDTINAIFYQPKRALAHTLVDGYANGWRLDEEQSTQADIVLIYRPQYIFYLGIVLFITVVAGWLCIFRKDE